MNWEVCMIDIFNRLFDTTTSEASIVHMKHHLVVYDHTSVIYLSSLLPLDGQLFRSIQEIIIAASSLLTTK